MKYIYRLFGYFKSGFFLTNKSFEIYLIGLVLLTLQYLNSYLPQSPFYWIFSIIFFAAFMFYIAYELTLPLFLHQKQKGQSQNFQQLIAIILKNTKKIVLPFIILFLIFLLLFFAFFALITLLLSPSKDSTTQFLQYFGKINQGFTLSNLVMSVISSFFIFTPFFFSLEGQGLIKSIKASILFWFHNIPLVLIIIFIEFMLYSIISFIPYQTVWGISARSIIVLYVHLIIVSGILDYYQKLTKKS